MGISVGMAIEIPWVGFDSGGTGRKRFLRFLVGSAVSVALWAGLKAAFDSFEPEPLFRFVRYGLLGLWISLGAPWIFRRLGLVKKT